MPVRKQTVKESLPNLPSNISSTTFNINVIPPEIKVVYYFSRKLSNFAELLSIF